MNPRAENDPVVDAVAALLQRHCTPAFVRGVEEGGSAVPLLRALAEAGFLEVMADEADGGAALPMAGLAAIAWQLGAHAAPLPVAQTMATRWLVAQGSRLPAGAIAWAPVLRVVVAEGAEMLECPCVPFGATARHVLTPWRDGLALFNDECAVRAPTDVVGHGVATWRWPADTVPTLLPWRGLRAPPPAWPSGARPQDSSAPDSPDSPDQGGAATAAFVFNAMGAAIHAALMGGAMKCAFDLTLRYANDRVQFGRSIGKYQAIQHQLAAMAEQVASVRLAVAWAFGGGRDWPSLAACAVAKARASEAAQSVAAMAHAVHGAIGITAEYDLQLFTRRLHEWRVAHGSENHWAVWLGERCLQSGHTMVDFVRALDA